MVLQQQPQQQSGGGPDEACPMDKEALGAATWSLLHTLAAHYPAQPSAYDEVLVTQLLQGLAHFYPCAVCRPDFEAFVLTHPPNTSSREQLVLWVCELHNDVNRKLGREEMACDLAALDRRWLDNADCD